MYKNVSEWKIYDGFSYGSGTSVQEWIINPETEEIALFKKKKSIHTTDNCSEKISSEIANIIGVPAAKIDLAKRDNRDGMISYKINSKTEDLIEGVTYISAKYPSYNRDSLIDEDSGEWYNFQMILNAINGLNLNTDLLKVLIFDFIIGNTDRHHSNWAIIREQKSVKFCPVYDNASSLCAYIEDEKIKEHINDKNWINSLIDSKSTTIIKLDGKIKKKIKHSEFVRYLKDNYYLETANFVMNIKENLTYDVIDKLINGYNDILSDEKIKIIKIFLKKKLELLFEIYKV